MTLSSDTQASSYEDCGPTLRCSQSPEITYKRESHIELEATTLDSSICVEILEHRSVGFDHRSQVVVAKLIRGSLQGGDAEQRTLDAGSHILAKFYDPRYAEAGQDWVGGRPEMCAWSKENETRAYNILAALQGSDIPVFYGEYTCHPATHPDLRIAVLLFEFVEDPDLTKFNPLQYTADELQALETAAISTLQKIHYNGVYHYDISEGNLLWGRERKRMIFVDFDRAVFKDSGFVVKMLEGERYVEGHDRSMMDDVFERIRVQRKSVSSLPL